jgi:tetratricopeptide (TPR) repeat protein
LRRLELLTYQAEAKILSGQPGTADAIYALIMGELVRLGRDRGHMAFSIRNLRIDAANSSGDLNAALALIDDTLASHGRDFPDQPAPVLMLFERSLVLAALGRDREALAGFTALTASGQVADRQIKYLALLEQAVEHSVMGRAGKAEADFRRALEFARDNGANFGPSDDLAQRLARAKLDLNARQFDKAREGLTRALAADKAQDLARATIFRLRSRANLGAGDLTAAAADAQDGLALSERLRGDKPRSVWVGLASAAAADVAYARGDPAMARGAYAVVIDQLGNSVESSHPTLLRARERIRQLAGSGP